MLAGACSLPQLPPLCSLATAATTLSISSKKKNSYITKDGFNTLEKLIHKSIRASQTKEKGSTHHKSTHPQIDSYITDRGAGFNTNKITHLQIDSHNIEGGRGGQEGEIGDAAGQAKSPQTAGGVGRSSAAGPAQLLRRSGAGPLQLLSTPQM